MFVCWLPALAKGSLVSLSYCVSQRGVFLWNVLEIKGEEFKRVIGLEEMYLPEVTGVGGSNEAKGCCSGVWSAQFLLGNTADTYVIYTLTKKGVWCLWKGVFLEKNFQVLPEKLQLS